MKTLTRQLFFLMLASCAYTLSWTEQPNQSEAPSESVASEKFQYLPPEASVAKEGLLIPDGSKGFFDNSVTKEKVQELFDEFNKKFKDITFHADWADSTVNAFAWVDANGKRHCSIQGGMLRHLFMGMEGVTLVLAHEVGHHYGGEPTYPEGLSCEGQSDYWATLEGLRIVYNESHPGGVDSEKFIATVKNGVKQTYQLLTGGLAYDYYSPEARAQSFFATPCSHPFPACRRDTYIAGFDKAEKPICAGFAENISSPEGFEGLNLEREVESLTEVTTLDTIPGKYTK